VAPIQVVIVPIRQAEPGVLEACKDIKEKLEKENIRVKLDDDDSRTPGWKFAEYEMKGVPLRIEVGPRDLASKQAVLVKRVNGEKKVAPIEQIEQEIPSLLVEIHHDMYTKAKTFLDSHITSVNNIDELKAVLAKGGYAKMAYCGRAECEVKIKEITDGGTARCLALDPVKDGTLCPICGDKATVVAYFAKAY
jgi:prolyl-tRNA synthetase